MTAAERGFSTGSSAALAAAVEERPKGASLEFEKPPAFGRRIRDRKGARTRKLDLYYEYKLECLLAPSGAEFFENGLETSSSEVVKTSL
jgi:hypothetical protein